MLIERLADEERLVLICTILAGVLPLLSSLTAAGELRRIILSPGDLLGVPTTALFALTDRFKRGISFTSSCFEGDEEATGVSARRAWVTFENLMAGGGSSSESLSSMLMRLSIGASAEKP